MSTFLFTPSGQYSNEEIYTSLGIGNAGGIRIKLRKDRSIERIVIFTSEPAARIKGENPYQDRIEKDTLIYTGEGQEGHQTLAGQNQRIPEQLSHNFPIYGFIRKDNRRRSGPKGWHFIGLLYYSCHYKEHQIDSRGKLREAWIFEFRIQPTKSVTNKTETILVKGYLSSPEARDSLGQGRVLTNSTSPDAAYNIELEKTRLRMLAMQPVDFEHLIKSAVVASGFTNVIVTPYSQDGGVDVIANASTSLWPLSGQLLQIQAKRWRHTVGRREVAELRGSLKQYSHGALVTTGFFTKSALFEASEVGKQPITLVDGYNFARITSGLNIRV